MTFQYATGFLTGAFVSLAAFGAWFHFASEFWGLLFVGFAVIGFANYALSEGLQQTDVS